MLIKAGERFNFADDFDSDVIVYQNEVMQATEDFDMLEVMKKFLADNPGEYPDTSIDSFVEYLIDNDLASFHTDYRELGFYRLRDKANGGK